MDYFELSMDYGKLDERIPLLPMVVILPVVHMLQNRAWLRRDEVSILECRRPEDR